MDSITLGVARNMRVKYKGGKVHMEYKKKKFVFDVHEFHDFHEVLNESGQALNVVLIDA